MEQTLFYNTFLFRTIRLKSFHHTDNSKGIPNHFIARMLSGSSIIRTVSGEELHLEAGDVFYLPIGLQYHSYWTVDESEDPSVSWESYGFIHLPICKDVRYTMQKIIPSQTAIKWLDCLKENQAVSPSSVGYLYLFLSEVLPDLCIAEPTPKLNMLQTAMEYIKQNESFSVPKLARVCGISESGLDTLFRDYAHTTPIDFKHQLIAERAVVMLTTTDLSVEEIASILGLCSSAFLRRILKKQIGQTPLQIRKEAKFI